MLMLMFTTACISRRSKRQKALSSIRSLEIQFIYSCTIYLLALHLSLALVKRDIALDLVHLGQRIRIIPRCVLDLGLVSRDGVVVCVALVGAVGFGGRGAKVRFGDGVGWELCGHG
jgi:hypothetical protein